jgi:Mg-chelatase subunit ChlD
MKTLPSLYLHFRNINRLFWISILGALLAPINAAGSTSNNMLFILDGSNSMWGQVQGYAKIDIAKGVMADLLTDLPEQMNIGLMAYGHREEGSCEDIEVLTGISPKSHRQVNSLVSGIQPKGKTPIASSLSSGAALFKGLESQNNNLVLISDGVESCGGDPCAVAGELSSRGLGVRVHVVGFDVDAEARGQLECIARAGNGRYFNAGSAEELKVAFNEVKEEVSAPPEPEVVFDDEFDSDGLGDVWEVINPDPDAFIVEDDSLLLLASGAGSPENGDATNTMRLGLDVPPGDWTMTASVNLELQTGQEVFFIGLYKDNENFLFSRISVPMIASHFRLYLSSIKMSGGKKTEFSTGLDPLVPPVYHTQPFSTFADSLPQPFLLRLTKSGRSFTAEVKLEGLEDAQWIETDKLTLLRPKGRPAVGLYQFSPVSGESIALVNWFRIEAISE